MTWDVLIEPQYRLCENEIDLATQALARNKTLNLGDIAGFTIPTGDHIGWICRENAGKVLLRGWAYFNMLTREENASLVINETSLVATNNLPSQKYWIVNRKRKSQQPMTAPVRCSALMHHMMPPCDAEGRPWMASAAPLA